MTRADLDAPHDAGPTEPDRTPDRRGPAAATDSPEALLPLTAAQLGIWNAQRLEPDSPFYVVGDVIEIGGGPAIDGAALRRAIADTVDEADSLRVRIRETADGPRQWISTEPTPLPEVLDLRGESDPHAAAEAAVTAERARIAARCRAMTDRPLFAHRVLVLAEDEVWYTQLGHHLVFDGYSAAMLSRRVAARYTAAVDGTPLRPSPFGSFAELIADDAQYRAGEQHDADRAYWRDRLTPLPDIPPRGEVDGAAAGTLSARGIVDAATRERLAEVAGESGTTWGEAMIACYAAFLQRSTGVSDVVFALPLMCRTGSVALRTPAMAVNVLPLRVRVDAGDTLPELSARVAEAMREMRTHQRYRGEDLPRDLGAPGAGAILHGRGINLKAFDLTLTFGGASGVMRNVAGGPPEDYGLSVIPAGDDLLLGFEVDSRAADQDRVDRRMAAMLALIEGLTADDRPAVGQVPLRGAAESAALLHAWHTPDDAPLPSAIDALAALDPAAPALVAGTERLTAGDLTARVHRLARLLRARGVGADDVVAIALPRSADLIVALLAVLDAGAAYVCLDLAHPDARLRDLVADARPALVLTDSAHAGEPWRGDVPVLDLDGAAAELSTLSADPLVPRELSAPRHPDHLAYVIYTSGSTGRPKGVLGRVGGLASLLRHHRRTLQPHAARQEPQGRLRTAHTESPLPAQGVARQERLRTAHTESLLPAQGVARQERLRTAHTYSFSFDASLDQLLWLLDGHELHLYDTGISRDAEALAAAYAADRIDVVDTTPSMVQPLLDAGLLTSAHPPALLLLGGEATPPALWRTVAASGVPALNLYGPTEAAVDATAAPITGTAPTIGRAVAGTTAMVLDGALEPVPEGETGELYLAGPHLARGYLGMPGTTAERFVANPHGEPGSRMYRTGDRVRWSAAQGLEFLGRSDDQVKIRGYRIELGEAETALADVPGVTAAAVIVRSDGGRPRLVGYVTGAVDADAVRADLADRLPEHLVPSAVVVLDELPVTINGKLDRAALPAPQVRSEGRAPRTDAERTMVAVVAAALGLESVSIDDDLFSIGGDSISAITVCSALRAEGLEIRPREFLSGRTFAALAAAAQRTSDAVVAPPDEPLGEVPPPPIVRSLLAAAPDLDVIAGYAQWTALRVPAGLSETALAAAFDETLRVHDALRLQIGDDGVLVVPPVPASGSGEPPVLTVSDGAADPRSVAERLGARLDPRVGRMLVAELIRTGGDEDRLVIVAHHLVVDGVSWRILVPDLEAAYAGATIAPAATSWRSHALALAGTPPRPAETALWEAADAAVFRLGDRPLDPHLDTVATARISHTGTAAATTALLDDLAAAFRAGVDDVLLAALALTVAAWSRGARGAVPTAATVTVEGHGREPLTPGADLARTVGWFTTEFPLRLPLDAVADGSAGGDPSAGDLADALRGGSAAGRLLRAVKECKRAIPDGGIGHGLLPSTGAVPDATAGGAQNSAPDLVLNYLGRFADAPHAGWRLPEEEPFGLLDPSAKALEQVLAINCFRVGDGLRTEWTAASRAVSEGTVERLQELWARSLDGLAAYARSLGGRRGALTPSDVPLVRIPQAELDVLQADRAIADVLPATPLQVGLAYQTMLAADGDADAYVVQAATHLSGTVDPDRMRRAAEELLRRTPALRAYLAQIEGRDADDQVVQVVPTETAPEFRFIDLRSAPERFESEALVERTRPFDPAEPPLIRFLLCRTGGEEYRLAITNHHSLLDGWSMPIVGRTLLALYAELGGGPVAPAAEPLGEYFRWLAGRDAEEARTAWRSELEGLDAGTHLVPARPAGPAQAAERVYTDLGADLTRRVEALARAQGATLTSVLHTAWGVLLGRLTGRRDVTFGCPVSGRPPEVDGVGRMVGQLGNTIVVRVGFTPATPAATVIADVHARSLAVADHHHVGLTEITRLAGVGELFDTMVVTENFPMSDRHTESITAELDLTGVDIADATHYPLTLIVLPGETIRIGFGYRPELLDESVVRGYARWLTRLLESLVAAPDLPVGRLRHLPGDEERRVLDLGRVPSSHRRGPILDELAARTAETPDAEALVCRDRSLTFAELRGAVNTAARELIRRGVAPQDTVAVFAERDVEMTIALLAILTAGAVYLPLDPAHPAGRLQYMLDDAAPALVVTTGSVEIPAELAAERPVWHLAYEAGTVDPGDPAAARSRLTPDALAYVIYTSGTTGRPKGVAVPLRGLPDLISLQEEVVGMRRGERYLQFASTGFDVAVWQMLGPLLSGGTSVIAPDEVRLPGDELLDYIAEHRVTGVNLLPSFLAAMPDDRAVPDDVFFVVGAERLDPALARRWGEGRTALFNAYGPTEVTVNAVTWRYDPSDPGPLPIGRPDPDVDAYVLDDALLPVGVGVVGELYLAGTSVARGYLGRPDLTASAFTANPFGPSGSRMYRTGDRVCWREDGNLVFLGRVDHQVKIRGLRVELGEIETVLAQQDSVRAAAVLVRDDDATGKQRLVAYLVPSDGAVPDPGAIRAAAAQRLPDHMVPTAYVVLDRFPLGATGKLDRDALPAPAAASGGADRTPSTDAERALLPIFRDLLGDDIGMDDDFTDRGGDSLLSLQVVSRARRRGWTLSPRDVLEGRSVAGIARRAVPAARETGIEVSDFEDLLAVLRLADGEAPGVFVGRHPAKVGVHTFGGQILAQAIVAAGRTVDGLPLHAAHTHFVELGSVTADLVYRVVALRDTPSAANRQVTVEQDGRVVAVMTLAYQADAPDPLTHADPAPRVAPPESLPRIQESFAGRERELHALVDASHPIDMRFASDPVWVRRETETREGGNRVWMRADGALPDDQVVHDAALAWASDITVQDPIVMRHGLSWGYDRVAAATLNQSLWFHRPVRFDAFHLFATDSPVARRGRGLSTGHFYTRSGELVATVTQEAAVRRTHA
ncbi:non-ribosomal peptide synthetase [Tsukamurella pseudospumae]|uniref:Carrier domain-containing protein n=1 Tax=Tsukamurella pseudospumae TaxID=239498 RepID=A0A137ZK58_9ACTN|nr:non-ribosomal peptide synthetase [Tsukamurella pseudospumae]KXO98568.1 hypothetical protein AXK61_02985 [Tsukamurella pseudospumae]